MFVSPLSATLFLYHWSMPVSLDDSFTLPPVQKDRGPSAVMNGAINCPESSNLNATTLLPLLVRLFAPAIILLPWMATEVISSRDPGSPILKNRLPFPFKLLSG